MANEKSKTMLSAEENSAISRALLLWLNQWPDKEGPIRFDFLQDDALGLMMGTIQGAYIAKRYVRGAYQGRYEFRIIYRVFPGNSDNNRLKADEHLDSLADWAISRDDKPYMGANKTVTRIEANTRSGLLAVYEDGSEDHQILMSMDYMSM